MFGSYRVGFFGEERDGLVSVRAATSAWPSGMARDTTLAERNRAKRNRALRRLSDLCNSSALVIRTSRIAARGAVAQLGER